MFQRFSKTRASLKQKKAIAICVDHCKLLYQIKKHTSGLEV